MKNGDNFPEKCLNSLGNRYNTNGRSVWDLQGEPWHVNPIQIGREYCIVLKVRMHAFK